MGRSPAGELGQFAYVLSGAYFMNRLGRRQPPTGHTGLLDDLWPLWEDENKPLHDMIVKTHVVRA